MYPSTDPGAGVSPPLLKSEPPVPPLLASLAKNHVGELIVVHTGRSSYIGRLLSVTGVCVTLDSDSDALDQPVRTRIDSTRIEAVEILPD